VIAQQWGVAPAAFGPVFAAGLLGSFFGALSFGALGDRLGRRPALLLAVALFGATCLLTPFASSLGGLIAVRLLTGIGLGGALPGIISMTSEYSPHRIRATVIAVMFCGFPLGAVIGGSASALLIPMLGWKSLFYIGGAIPLLLLPILWFRLPESLRFLAQRQDREAVDKALARLGRQAMWNGEFVRAEASARPSVASLFSGGRAAGTALLWLTLFCSLLLTYLLINWIPLVVRQSGMPIQAAVLGVAALNGGAIFGCLALGRLADRFGQTITIGLGFALGTVAIAAIGWVGHSAGLLIAVTFTAGFLTIGAQMCTVAICATFYSTALRATGVGWAMGVGRGGAIVGPMLGGVLIGVGTAPPTLFGMAAVFSLVAAAAVLAMGRLGFESYGRRAAAAAAH
jgi:AAHS family 4-hydroxybenzoate transporter-like MFS transporter